MKKRHQQRRRTQAEKDAADRAMMASAEAVLGLPTKPQAVLQRIIEENPDADSSVIGAKLWHIAKNDPDLMRAIVDDVLKDIRRKQAN